jgi:hypothetical protein
MPQATESLHRDLAELEQLVAEVRRVWEAGNEEESDFSADLGDDVQRAGESLVGVLEGVRAQVPVAEGLRRDMDRLLADLESVVAHYRDLDEPDPDAALDIYDRLDSGIALVRQAL